MASNRATKAPNVVPYNNAVRHTNVTASHDGLRIEKSTLPRRERITHAEGGENSDGTDRHLDEIARPHN